jgi:hypothetical protein
LRDLNGQRLDIFQVTKAEAILQVKRAWSRAWKRLELRYVKKYGENPEASVVVANA